MISPEVSRRVAAWMTRANPPISVRLEIQALAEAGDEEALLEIIAVTTAP